MRGGRPVRWASTSDSRLCCDWHRRTVGAFSARAAVATDSSRLLRSDAVPAPRRAPAGPGRTSQATLRWRPLPPASRVSGPLAKNGRPTVAAPRVKDSAVRPRTPRHGGRTASWPAGEPGGAARPGLRAAAPATLVSTRSWANSSHSNGSASSAGRVGFSSVSSIDQGTAPESANAAPSQHPARTLWITPPQHCRSWIVSAPGATKGIQDRKNRGVGRCGADGVGGARVGSSTRWREWDGGTDRRLGPDQGVSEGQGRRRPVVHRGARPGDRIPRPERLGQDDHAAHDAQPGHADQRDGDDQRPALRRAGRAARHGRRGARGVQRAQGPHRAQPPAGASAPRPATRPSAPTRCWTWSG